jgi:hypothetical protein
MPSRGALLLVKIDTTTNGFFSCLLGNHPISSFEQILRDSGPLMLVWAYKMKIDGHWSSQW